jgi:hypothetical protein
MKPAESRKLANLMQNLSPTEKIDFYYFTVVKNEDPIKYFARINGEKSLSKRTMRRNKFVR